MTAMQSRHFPSWYSLPHDDFGLLEYSHLLKGNYFNNWFWYNFNVNYSLLDYYIHTFFLMMAIQSRLLTSRYPLTPDAVVLLKSSPLLEGYHFNKRFIYYFNINYSLLDYYISTLYLMMAMQSRLLISWYPLTPETVWLLESSLFLKKDYFNKWFLYNFFINYSPLDYYIHTLYFIKAMQSRLLTSWYPLTPDAVGLLKSSLLLEGNYLINWFLYNLYFNYSPLDYYIHTLYSMLAMQSLLITFWYPLTPDAVGLLESSPLLKGNYFNKWFLYYFNINNSSIDYYISTLYLIRLCYADFFLLDTPWPMMSLGCWNPLLY
jgi:hypothetical protein